MLRPDPDPRAPVTLDEAFGPNAPMVVFDRVSLAFDERVILEEVSFTLLKGHTKIIIGASGAGKSTILKLILGLLRPDAGVVWVLGERVDQMSELELMKVRAHLGMVFQEGALFDSLTVRENVGYRLYEETDLPPAEVDARVEEILGFVGLAEHIDKMPSELSGGQRRRVAIARAMTAKPRILLYDEPTTGLDPIMGAIIDALIVEQVKRLGATAFSITHDMASAQRIGDTVAMIHGGRIIWVGPASSIRESGNPYVDQFVRGSSEGPIKMELRK